MLRFKQFLIEGLVPFYHKTDPGTAARLVSGEKIKPQGLSVFIDPAKAADTVHRHQNNGQPVYGDDDFFNSY